MPNLFTRRARLRWLEMQREKAREAWERLGRLYIGLYGRVLDRDSRQRTRSRQAQQRLAREERNTDD